MKHPRIIIGFILIITLMSIVPLTAQEAPPPANIRSEVLNAVQQNGQVGVIINLNLPAGTGGSGQAMRQSVATAQDAVLTALANGTGGQRAPFQSSAFNLRHQFEYTPALAGTISQAGLDALANHSTVDSIQLDVSGQGALAESRPLINADDVESVFGLTGAGVRVAVVDSGIDTDHPDFNDGALVAQKCFVTYGGLGDCPPSNTTISNNAEDEAGHGTHVSGIITSENATYKGIAPDANIVAVRVLNRDNGFDAYSDVIAGLDWIVANQGALQVDIVNMSLGTGATFSSNCDATFPAVASVLTQMYNLGITTFVATHNYSSSTHIASPACNSHVIAVGSTTKADAISSFSNSNALLDILAPGSSITASGMGGGQVIYSGTSMATPTAAGVAALLLQANPSLTPDQIEAILKSTGLPIFDARNGITRNRVDAYAAVSTQYAPQGLLTDSELYTASPAEPTFTWSRVGDAVQYKLFVWNAAKTTIINQTFAAESICDSETCTVSGSDYTLPVWGLVNKGYEWWVGAVPSGKPTRWSSKATFSVDIDAPPITELAVDPGDGRITVSFDDDPDLYWVQIWIGSHPTSDPYYEWHGRDMGENQFSCDAGTCTAKIPWDVSSKYNGNPVNFMLWMRAWGPGGYSTGGVSGAWYKLPFSLPQNPPIAPQNITLTTPSGNLNIAWDHSANATWYQLTVVEVGTGTIHKQWYLADDLGCGPTCWIPDLMPLTLDTEHTIWMRAWGPGGFSTGGNFVNGQWNSQSIIYTNAGKIDSMSVGWNCALQVVELGSFYGATIAVEGDFSDDDGFGFDSFQLTFTDANQLTWGPEGTGSTTGSTRYLLGWAIPSVSAEIDPTSLQGPLTIELDEVGGGGVPGAQLASFDFNFPCNN